MTEARLDAAIGGTAIGLWDSGVDDDCQWSENWCERFDIDPCGWT